jgi:hypothetical protein
MEIVRRLLLLNWNRDKHVAFSTSNVHEKDVTTFENTLLKVVSVSL